MVRNRSRTFSKSTRSKLGVLAMGVALGIGSLLGGCAGKQANSNVVNVSGMIPIKGTKLPNVHAYETPTFDPAAYSGILIDPADVSTAPEADFGGVSQADQLQLAAKLTSEFKRVLSPNSHVVDAPGPGIVRVHLTLLGVNQSRPVLSTALRLTPIGLVMSATRGLQDKSASFVGSINVAGVAYDSQTGEVLAAAQAIISPSSMNLTSGLTPLRAAELITTKAAEAFRDYLARTLKR